MLAGVVRRWLTDPSELRSVFLGNLWTELQCYGARRIQDIELSRIRGIDGARVAGPIRRHGPLILSALSALLECETVFVFGLDLEDTAWLLAHNLPNVHIFLFDEGSESVEQVEVRPTDRLYRLSRREHGSPLESTTSEVNRVSHLRGDSGTFDFVPYSGTADLVHIDGSRDYSHVRSDTEAAFGLLSELGTIVWDGYTGHPGTYAYLNELAPSVDRPIFHILGTRLALYSRWDIVLPESD